MPQRERIYLDNAATSYPKPEAVYTAVDTYNRRIGAAVGRGAYQDAIQVQSVVARCRKRAAELLGVKSPDHIIFTFNGTDSLNLAIHGLLEPGDHVVTSRVEHNSVLRPLKELEVRKKIQVSHVDADETGLIDIDKLREVLRPTTKLVAILHASNVTGTLQPIADVGQLARESGALFLLDAAQTAGHLPFQTTELPVDLVACPGHKGLLGPLGTGLLYVRPAIEERLHSVRQGGTGSQSEVDQQPDFLPDKYESGNHNAPGLYGLEAGLAYLQERGVDSVHRHESDLVSRLLAGLAKIDGLRIVGKSSTDSRVGVVSIVSPLLEPQILATLLDESFGIQTRAGFHCAPGVHKCAGTFQSGGTVRFSVGPFTTNEHIDCAVAALNELTRA